MAAMMLIPVNFNNDLHALLKLTGMSITVAISCPSPLISELFIQAIQGCTPLLQFSSFGYLFVDINWLKLTCFYQSFRHSFVKVKCMVIGM